MKIFIAYPNNDVCLSDDPTAKVGTAKDFGLDEKRMCPHGKTIDDTQTFERDGFTIIAFYTHQHVYTKEEKMETNRTYLREYREKVNPFRQRKNGTYAI